jgi:hypothetical protein
VIAVQRDEPIIVRVVEQPVHETTISDVIVGSLGLVGVMLVSALLLGLLLGGALLVYKRFTARDGIDGAGDSQALRVTPNS